MNYIIKPFEINGILLDDYESYEIWGEIELKNITSPNSVNQALLYDAWFMTDQAGLEYLRETFPLLPFTAEESTLDSRVSLVAILGQELLTLDWVFPDVYFNR
jgi:hypothetical protein